MKIQYASDLHLEFHENCRWLKDNPLLPVGDVLVLAGDIGYLGDENYERHQFWGWCAENFRQTIVIPGNHELYKGFNINELHEGWQLNIRPNVKAVYNCVIPISQDIELIASTLWAKIPPYEEFQTERGVTRSFTSKHKQNNRQYPVYMQSVGLYIPRRANQFPPGCHNRN